MKLNRTYAFISISSLALVIVLMIQVNWIVETAKVKEQLFTEKANIVLSKVADHLASDKETVNTINKEDQNLRSIVINSCRTNEVCISNPDIEKINALFNQYMLFYNFHIDYSFVLIKDSTLKTRNGFSSNIYCRRLEELASKNGLELVLIIPDKEEFIIQEMGVPFISSVVLILVVLVMFWRTVISLMKEKEISEHTNDFLNNMTHEFKTPLTNIALAGKMIVKESAIKDEEKIRHYSGIILEENEKLRLQVEQVLSMTALERGEIPLQKSELDIHALILNCIKPISIQLENLQGSISTQLRAERTHVMGDKTHLANALCNLIDNAIKYSKEPPELRIETENDGNGIRIVVADKGIGIERKYHDKVFDKFFRIPTGNLHDVKGFGLGLAYIKKIVELHGGKIELNSEKNEGATFIITLPNA